MRSRVVWAFAWIVAGPRCLGNLCAVRCGPLFKFPWILASIGPKLAKIGHKWRFWGRKAPLDRFCAHFHHMFFRAEAHSSKNGDFAGFNGVLRAPAHNFSASRRIVATACMKI